MATPDATNFLASLLPQRAGKSSEAVTEKTDLTPEAMQGIIRAMMEGDSGLAGIMKGQAGSGLYNSSTTQLLANDLAARVGERAALASAPKTTSRSAKSTMGNNSAGVDPKWAMGLKLAEALSSRMFGQDARTGGAKTGTGPNQSNNVFQRMMDSVLGRSKKAGPDFNTGSGFGESSAFGSFLDGGAGFSGGNFDFSQPLGFTGGGGSFNNIGAFFPQFGSGGGFGSGGFDSLSYGLGGGGYDSPSYSFGSGGYSYDPFSGSSGGSGGNYSFGNSYSSPSSVFSDSFSPGGFGSGFDDGFGVGNNYGMDSPGFRF